MTLTLPAPFDAVELAAHLDRGRRSITWRIEGPGQLARNGFEMAWFDVTERDPFRGEPLWLSATRRPLGRESYGRGPFTDAGRQAIADLLLPVIARYGFDRAWTELHQAKAAGMIADANAGQAHALTIAGWWEERAELARMLEDGRLRFVPVDTGGWSRSETVLVLDPHGRRDRQDVAARAVLDGEQVGWMTRRGDLVPLEDRTVRNVA